MAYFELKTLKHSICLKLLNCQHSEIGITFVGLLALVFFVMPVLMMFYLSIEIKLGSILVCILAWFISAYFFRLYLWNKYGEEIFTISRNRIERYNNYKIYKEKIDSYSFIHIDILFYIKRKAINLNLLDIDYSTIDYNQLSVIGFKLDNEIIISHREIPILDIIEIAKNINYLKTKLRIPSAIHTSETL